MPAHPARWPDLPLVADEDWLPNFTPETQPWATTFPQGLRHRRRDPSLEGRSALHSFAPAANWRKAVTHNILAQIPVIVMAYDLLEYRGGCPR